MTKDHKSFFCGSRCRNNGFLTLCHISLGPEHCSTLYQLNLASALLEMTTAVLMRQKDEELMNASSKINELLESLKVSKEETKMWKRIAKENEVMALVFSNIPEEESNPCFSSTAAVPDEKMVPPALVSDGEGWNQSVQGKSEQNSN